MYQPSRSASAKAWRSWATS